MNAFGPYLAALHLQELLDEAAIERRARSAHTGHSSVSTWRRGLGSVLVTAARSLDPSVETAIHEARSSESRSARAAA